MPYTKQNARVVRVQCDITYNHGGAMTAANTAAFLVSRVTNDEDPSDTRGDNDLIPVTFDLLDNTLNGVDITAMGETVSYAKLAALLRQMGLDRANAQGIT